MIGKGTKPKKSKAVAEEEGKKERYGWLCQRVMMYSSMCLYVQRWDLFE